MQALHPSITRFAYNVRVRQLVKLKNPLWGIASAFCLTAIVARLTSYVAPRLHWEPIPGLHLHHYVYGIFILTAAGYLALFFKSPRATLSIALLYGVGVALTFDEMRMWWNPRIERGARWNYNGLVLLIAAFALCFLLHFLLRRGLTVAALDDRRKHLIPDSRQS